MIDSKWDHRFMRLAREISTWSKDPSSKIGAIIVDDQRRILGTGYNGFPQGIKDTEERLTNKEEKYPRIIHGEMNALLNCLRNGVSVTGATLYVYSLPICSDCTKSVIQAGIKRVVITYPHLNPGKWEQQWIEMSLPMFNEANISATYMNPEKLDFTL